MLIIDVDGPATSLVPDQQYRAELQGSGPSASISAHPGRGRATPDISQNSKSP
jgi:hypothetical protein